MLVASAPLAFAHVTVDAPGLEPGGYGVLTFRVPTESDDASTTGLTVQIPGMSSVRTEPVPGWDAEIVRDPETNTVTEVRWVAEDNDGIGPEEFGLFRISVGPLPEHGPLLFPAVQQYSDGTVVEWFEEPNPDHEPDRPAPVIDFTEGTEASHAAPQTSDNTARWLGGSGLILGALGAALGLGAFARKGGR